MKKIKTIYCFTAVIVIMLLSTGNSANAQQYKLRQVTSSMGMKSESTIYVKGNRKRTEGGGYAGMNKNLGIIEQCDKQRTISLNTKKKLYFIESFSNRGEEITDDNSKPALKNRPAPTTTKKGGIIYSYQNITDTGERRKMFGMTARHVWSTQKIKPSADACMMKDSMLMNTDGWYIDLPDFNCYSGSNDGGYGGGYAKPDCQDRFVTKRTGKGKLGLPLIETRTIIMGGESQTSEFKTDIETLELSNAKLDSMLFEIPEGYTETKNREDLNEPFNADELSKQFSNPEPSPTPQSVKPVSEQKLAGIIRIAVYAPHGGDGLNNILLQEGIVAKLTGNSVQGVAVSSKDEARKFNCDFLLTTEFIKLKQGSKLGGLLNAVKNADQSSVASYNIEVNMTLSRISDGITRSLQIIGGKFTGKADDAAMKALDNGCEKLVSEIK